MEGLDRRAVDAKRRGVDPLMATASKHYVRTHVWLPVARDRANRLGRRIQYFTLTTADLFDVRVLDREGLLEHTERGYPGVGFCEFDDKTFDDIMRKLRWCGWSYKGWFEDMVRNHPSFQEDFCFDVINLDFILVPFPDQESPLEGTWGAIQQVLQVQWNHRRSFDLLLTFRGSPQGTNADALSRVADLLSSNLGVGRGTGQWDARVGHRDAARLVEENYLQFLSMGLPKLLVGDALPLGFELTRVDVYTYPREGAEEAYHIMKFVFSFAVPLIFARQPQDIAGILHGDAALVKALEEDLASLKAA